MSNYIKWIREKVGQDKIILNFVSGGLRDKQGRILLQKRTDKKVWGFPGGAIELGQSFEEAVIREYLEETGILVKVKSLVGIYSNYEDSYPNGDKVQPISVFFELCYVSGELSVQDEETMELQFFDEAEIPKLVNEQHEDFLADWKEFNGQVLIR
ncbi:NUDIX hydrolase [Listeria cossartiae]|uniref:NUDIX hydrolase n=1 Tax=Listeria cossartiae TaxID=2838249 RepID=UPI0016237C62|nr:NUDIX domain-containing protein [Listeria cossartiae]MBC1544938.1 NUDIX domain-containing protein [Listeria cossartiae subsp. cossartiae]MBC1546981.1 NUDIX domain-containing protein [Listeria cossartiae subsp. cossartiae]MBC1550562.1 NUDIX domain-containing protein [Listeria cossartiae subsp. cossartiae]MBC1569480.1 NUDIX domain-containing protein [Listeria cossartiae subsp. cossartiae]MBC1572115.1 NUDIX domain-containing protein [Listeria cossartiae subsp. cossartiae]